MKIDLDKFNKEGYLGPFKLNDQSKFSLLLRETYIPRKLYTWYKSPHEKSAQIVRIASDESIVDKLRQLLGNDILLWGSLFINQKPGSEHEWHLDVEHGSWDGATVWIGLKNLNNKTSVSLITYSHLLNTSPIELYKKNSMVWNHGSIDHDNRILLFRENEWEVRLVLLKASWTIDTDVKSKLLEHVSLALINRLKQLDSI